MSKVQIVQIGEDIAIKCLTLCQQYLSGNWRQQTVDKITVKEVMGGKMNKMFHCAINEQDHAQDCPQEVAVRFYGDSDLEALDKTRIRDSVISLLFSMRNLGPKVYAFFDQGQIIQYFKVFKLNKINS